jgi:hypothetical protein
MVRAGEVPAVNGYVDLPCQEEPLLLVTDNRSLGVCTAYSPFVGRRFVGLGCFLRGRARRPWVIIVLRCPICVWVVRPEPVDERLHVC